MSKASLRSSQMGLPPSFCSFPRTRTDRRTSPAICSWGLKMRFFCLPKIFLFFACVFSRKNAKINDFDFPKPSPNPSKTPSKSMFQKTSIFSRFFATVFVYLLSWKPWKYQFSLGKTTIFKVFAQNVFLQFSRIFGPKNLSKTLPKRSPNDEKIDVKNVLFFNIDFWGFRPRFWRVLGLQDGAKLAQNGLQT